MDDQRMTYAHRLRSLATDQRFRSRADDLNSLADELADEDDGLTATWAGLDLFQAFEVKSVVNVSRHNAFERLLGVLAGVSVFLPVAWTWWSFHSASSAYRSLIADGVDQTGQTFLSLWATGFDGRLSGLHLLVPMSIVSVFLIGVAVVLIAGHRIAAARNVRREDASVAAAYAELASSLAGAQRVLNGSSVDDPKQLQNLVRTSVRHLLKAHEATEAGAHELATATRQVSEALTPVLSALDSASSRTATAANSVEKAGTVLTTSVERTETGVRKALADFSTVIGKQAEELRQQTVAAIAEVGQSTQHAANNLASNVDKLASTQREVAAQVADLSSTNRSTNTELQSILTSLSETVAAVDRTLSMTASAMQGQASELSQAHDAAERMLRAIEALTPQPAAHTSR